MKHLTLLIIASLGLLFISACEKARFLIDKTETIEGIYQNGGFGGPRFESITTTNYITYDQNLVSAKDIGNSQVEISIGGIQTKYDKPKSVKDFFIYEKINNSWDNQSEFKSNFTSTKTPVNAVIVLDFSSSIGSNIDDVKSYAKDFITKIFESNENSKIGLVIFNQNILAVNFVPKSKLSDLIRFIDDNKDYNDQTKLFEAVQTGLDMFSTLSVGDNATKVLIAFTDGGDNASNMPEMTVDKIKSSSIKRFAIGVDGADYRRDDLKKVCSDKNWIKARNYNHLKEVFEEVAQLVTSVYTIQYRRSNQILEKGIEIKFKFKLQNE